MNVDELASSLSDGFFVSDSESAVYNPCRPHPRFADYKSNNFTKRSQEKRRRELLERQREKRFDAFSTARNLDSSYDDNDELCESSMDVSTVKPKKNSRKLNASVCKQFKDQLMLSEWLVDVPETFSSNWYMMPCPEGKRCLVVAERGETRSFSKGGYERSKFQSLLPGGCKNSFNHETWLDCVFANQSFYVLDVIQWQDVSIYDGDREFRYFWAQQKFADLPGIGSKSSKNRYPFVLPPQYLCTNDNIASAMKEEFPFKVDGLLFYCNEAHYYPGLTPLVGWLKPFMIKEILNVDVPEKYAVDGVGTTTAEFIDKYNSENQRKNVKTTKDKKDSSSMEIETSSENVD